MGATHASRNGASMGPAEGSMRLRRWVDLFAKNRACTNQETLCLMEQEGDRVKLETDNTDQDALEFCLAVRFLGCFPGWKAMKDGTRLTHFSPITHCG